jgi:acetyl esterase
MLKSARRLRARAQTFLIETTFRSVARLGQMHPRANPAAHGLEVIRDLPYRATGLGAHTLDVWRPVGAGHSREPLPVVLYVHGGGFRILSKETHWVMALAYARRGYVVFNVNYRLAPMDPFPAAIEDSCAALRWVADNAERFGGDAGRIILAGESAGANLVTALAVATSYQRPEPYARAVWDHGIRPVACMPACGILQVSDHERFLKRKKLPGIVANRIAEVALGYLHQVKGDAELADPLLILERERPHRPLPPFFTICGTADPILDDTRRLGAALTRHGVDNEVHLYPGEPHAFHALAWRPNARDAWKRGHTFLERVLSVAPQADLASAPS